MPKEWRSKDPYKVHYDKEVLERPKSYLLDFGGGNEQWIPKSEITDKGEEKDGTQWLEIPEWLAYEKGLL